MMSSDNVPTAKPVAKDENQNTGARKTASARPPEQGLKCPRCDSANTKFCYYNNYSLTQPRHFCKTCRRYWTKGGALRNVPIGGGCRKNKKVKSSSRLSSDSKDSTSSSELGGLKFFHGFPPAMDFQLGGLSFPRLHQHQPSPTGGIYTQFASFGDLSATSTAVTASPSCFSLDQPVSSNSFLGFNHPFSSGTGVNGVIHQTMGSMNVHTSLASSIESLSSINQDLHWKLQQQRLAMLFGADNQKENNSVSTTPEFESHTQRPQPILFQNLEISRPEICSLGNSRSKEGPSGDTSTEWLFGNTFAPVTPTTTTANSSGNNGGDNISNWNGAVQGWGDHSNHQPFGPLP